MSKAQLKAFVDWCERHRFDVNSSDAQCAFEDAYYSEARAAEDAEITRLRAALAAKGLIIPPDDFADIKEFVHGFLDGALGRSKVSKRAAHIAGLIFNAESAAYAKDRDVK